MFKSFSVARATPISPSLHRIFIAFLIAATPALVAANTLTEADIIRLARINNPQADVLAQEITTQHAAKRRTALRRNPTLAWQQENRTSASEREDTLVLTLPINRTQRQKVGRALADVDVAEAESAALVGGSIAVRRALELFYLTIAQKQRIQISQERLNRLIEAMRIVSRRREEGSLSGYDSSRIELETEIARSEVEEARTILGGFQSALAPLIGAAPEDLKLDGPLLPTSDRESPQVPPESPALAALRASAGFAEGALRRAKNSWMPTVSVSAGLIVADGQETDYGYVAGLSLNLPVWTGSSVLRSEARARQQKTLARVGALTTERTIREAVALQSLRGLRSESDRFRNATSSKVEHLDRATESGYREGQRTLLELLDSNRTLLSVRLRQLELHLAVRKADVELRDARGEFE